MNDKTKLLLIAIAALVVVLCLVIGIALFGSDPKTPPVDPLAEPTDTSTAPETIEMTATEVPTVPLYWETPTAPDETQTQPSTEPGQTEPTTKPIQTEPAKKEPAQTEPAQTQPTQPGPTAPPAITFPYTIPGTKLVIQKIDSYDGIFLEDGSDREVAGISTMVLKNEGSTDVEYLKITLEQDGTQLRFEGTAIPAGSTVVIQEAGAAAYRNSGYHSCIADVAETAALEMSASMVSVTENKDGSLQVTNLTKETIPSIRVFYKFALTKGKIYVGGITYTAVVKELGPGASLNISPSHYAAGSSQVVMVRTYETAD